MSLFGTNMPVCSCWDIMGTVFVFWRLSRSFPILGSCLVSNLPLVPFQAQPLLLFLSQLSQNSEVWLSPFSIPSLSIYLSEMGMDSRTHLWHGHLEESASDHKSNRESVRVLARREAQASWHVSPCSCCEQKGNFWADHPWWGPSTGFGDVDPPALQASMPARASEGRRKLCPSDHPSSECPRGLLHLALFLCKDLLSCGPGGVKLTEREKECELPLSVCLSVPYCPPPLPLLSALSLSMDPPRPPALPHWEFMTWL